jgi:hypothetical protein
MEWQSCLKVASEMIAAGSIRPGANRGVEGHRPRIEAALKVRVTQVSDARDVDMDYARQARLLTQEPVLRRRR